MNSLNNRPLMKTVGGVLLFGDGDIPIQAPLVSGTNIKTINGASLLGAGNLALSGGALVYLSTVTAIAAATVDIETGFSATYDDYLIIANDIYGSTTSNLFCRLKVGGAYLTTNSYYFNQVVLFASIAAPSGNNGNGIAYSHLGISNSLLPTNPISLRCMLYDTNRNTENRSNFETVCGYQYGTAGFFGNSVTGVLQGVRFYAATGNISGTFKLYGVAKA